MAYPWALQHTPATPQQCRRDALPSSPKARHRNKFKCVVNRVHMKSWYEERERGVWVSEREQDMYESGDVAEGVHVPIKGSPKKSVSVYVKHIFN